MSKNLYMINRQKLLFMVEELHQRGYGKLRIIPYLAPSGLHWRCNFIDENKESKVIVSNWINEHEDKHSKDEIQLTIQELADLFVKENDAFIEHCKGENKKYENWYSEMLKQLTTGELPYAFSDYESSRDFWFTSNGNKIKTLSNERNYYF